MRRQRQVRYVPRDVALQRLLHRIVREHVREVHHHRFVFRTSAAAAAVRHAKHASHATVLGRLFGRRIVLDDVPAAHQAAQIEVAERSHLRTGVLVVDVVDVAVPAVHVDDHIRLQIMEGIAAGHHQRADENERQAAGGE